MTKLDEKEVKEKQEKADITWSGVTKDFKSNVKKIWKNILDFLKNITLSFTKLDSSIQICIIIPIAILLVVIGNKIYTDRDKKVLTCHYSNYSASMKISQELTLIFNKDRIYKQTVETTYEVTDPKVKTLGELETEKRDSNEELVKYKGVTAKYKIQDEKLINRIEYDYYKLSIDDMNELRLDKDSSLERYKERYENFGYQCESDK